MMEFYQIIRVLLLIAFIRVNKSAIVFVLFLMSINANSQELFPKDSILANSFNFSLDVGAGVSYYSTKPNVPLHLETEVNKINQIYTLRVNWKTDHRLTVSVESGYLKMYSYKLKSISSEGEISVVAIPVLLEFSMPLTNKFHIRAGAGSYFQTTKLDYLGIVNSSSISLGWTAGGSYYFYNSTNSTAGIEVKWMDAAESEQAVVAIQFVYRYSFLKW